MGKKMKITTRILSVFLSMVLLFEVIPMQVFATDVMSANDILMNSAEEENTEAETDSDENAQDTENTPAEILSEDTEKREESVKHFRMSDGTMQAAQYAIPVHFEKDGVWTDYDNTLTEVEADEEENAGKLLKNKDLVNTASDYSVRLSKKTNGKKFVRLEKDGYKISWYYQNANKSTAKIEQQEEDDDPTTLEKLTSTVLYEDVFKATDFEYILNSEGVKENLLLQSAKAPTVFTAEYKSNGLTPVAVDEKTVELRAEDGTVIYVISAPYMEDANSEISNGVTLSIISEQNNTFTLQMDLDVEWLSAEERAFPVTVDPVIQTQKDNTEMTSTFVESKHPDMYHGTGQDDLGSMYVGRHINEFGTARAYIKVNNLPDIGGIASKVVDARLSLCKRNVYTTADSVRVNAYKVTSDWTKGDLKYNKRPTNDGDILDYMVFAADNKIQPNYHDNYMYPELKTIEITDTVREWYEGAGNYGIMLDTDVDNLHKIWYFSMEYTDYKELRPVLTVFYRNMSGYEDYWSYTNITAGRSGDASVNNYNGNFVFAQQITQDDGGNLMPVTLSLVYNANQEKRNSGEQKPYVMHSLVGAFMQTNYHIYIRYDSKLAANGYKYYMNDADGTKHWFYKTDDASKFTDEDGLGLTLQEIALGSDEAAPEAQYCITDKDENKLLFDDWGNLIQIRNASGVSVNIAYEEVESGVRRMTTITDGAGRVYTFLYGLNGQPEMVTGVKDPAGRTTEIVYNGDFTVNSVKFADGKTVQFLHSGNESNYLITEIKGIDDTRTKISYDSSKQKRVTQINWGTSDNNLLEKYSFTYKQNSTQIADIQNRSYTYQFNDFGQTTGVVSDTDGSAQFFELKEGNSPDRRANKLLSESRVLQSVTNYVVNPGFARAYADGYVNYTENTADQSISIDSSKKNLTDSALKIYKGAANTGRVNAVQRVNGLPAGTYTFSAYVNTDGTTLSGDAWVLAEVWTTSGGYVSSNWAENTTKTDGWERKCVTFDVPDGCQVRLIVGFSAEGSGTVWFDDLQLEKGEGVNTYNLVENSGFTNGTAQWSVETTLADTQDLSGFAKCGYRNCVATDRWQGISHPMLVSGKANDVYSFGAWLKAASVPIDNGTKEEQANKPAFNLTLHYYNADGSWKGCKSIPVNVDLKNQWQFVSGEIIIPSDYYKLSIEVIYFNNVNTLSVTGAFCYKEQYGQTYDYDKDGNVVSTVDLAKTNSTFAYYGNQMSKMLNPSGSKYMYTYHKDNKQLLYALSSDGQEYGFSYDVKGNVTKAEITARQPATTLEDGKAYYLVNAYSGQAMDSYWAGNAGDQVTTFLYTPRFGEQQWVLQAVPNTTDEYYLRSLVKENSNMYLDVPAGTQEQGAILQIYPFNGSSTQKFKIVKKQDNTFGIFTACTNYEKCLDGQLEKGNEIILSQKVRQAACNPNALPEGMRWYFYPVEASEDKTIVTETSYTESKNFVAATADQRGNITKYTYDEQKGTLTSTTDALNRMTNYTYDANNNSLLSVSSGGMTNSYTYENDRLKTINVNNALQYRYNYDVFGRKTSMEVGNGTNFRTLSSLEYNNTGLISKETFGNGDYINYTYDNLDRITEKKYNGSSTNRATYLYGADGSLAQMVDISVGTRTQFTYDLADRLVSQKEYATTAKNGGTLHSSTDFTYADKTNYLTGIKHFSPLGTQNISYTYGDINKGEMPDQVYKVSWNGQEKVNYTYDGLGRLTNKSVIVGGGVPDAPRLNTRYTYVNVGDSKTTSLVHSVQTAAGTFTYTYDEVGNIKTVSDGTYTTSYLYDNLNQLVRENNQKLGVTITYAYQNGNITERKEYAYTTGNLTEQPRYVYSWGYADSTWSDLMTSWGETGLNGSQSAAATFSAEDSSVGDGKIESIFDRALAQRNGGISLMNTESSTPAFSYDESGNPTNILGIQFSWNGRQLTNVSLPDDPYYSNVSYQYNIDGQRISKTVTETDGTVTTTEYFYNGEILAGQKTGNTVVVFQYDNNNDYFGFTVDGRQYYYVKNAQSDVVAITNADGDIVARYDYDAWGTASEHYLAAGQESDDASLNPFLYRSYYMDDESGFYYLNTRYYISAFSRFLNADDTDVLDENQDSLVENNLFAYCLNNPISFSDPDGNIAVSSIVGAVVGGATGAVLGILLANKLGLRGWKKGALIAAATIGGAALGAFLGPYVAKLAKMAGGAVKKAALNLGRKASSRLAYKSIGKITTHKMSHINVSKHLWNRVLKKVTSNGIEKLIKRTIRWGVWETNKNGVTTISYKYSGQIIVVTGRVINGVFKVGNAWVNR